MNRISSKFNKLKKEKKKALISFITAGDPDISVTASLILELARRGADLIEIGIPFSDPLADGPTIQRSYDRALKRKISLKNIIEMVRDVRKKTNIPIIFMSSYNLILSYGDNKLIRDASGAGVDGLIIPDLPPEESRNLLPLSDKLGLDIIFLLAPTSGDGRIKLVCEMSRGFIYYISVTGITGERKKISRDIEAGVKKIKKFTGLPVAVGFGVSNPAQAAEVSSYSDGVVVGSANVKIVEQFQDDKDLIAGKVGDFTASLKAMM